MVEDSRIAEFCNEYETLQPLYEQYSLECRALIGRLLDSVDLSAKCHSVTCRPKELESLAKKLGQEDKHYESLSEVTDLAGVRIITYFADDVDVIARLIEEEFEVDWENSIDKRATLDPDRFGYLSLHYVCEHKKHRADFRENERYRGLKLEIQMRSILQHAWAEIEHDLGYKNPDAIPALVKRRTFSLAGLLEVGDNEFIRIRDDVNSYAERVGAEISRAPDDVGIDKISLLSFVTEDELVQSVDAELAELLSADLETEPDGSYLGPIVGLLRATGFESINELREALEVNKTEVVEHYGRTKGTTTETDRKYPVLLSRGLSLFRLLVLVLAKQRDPELFRAAWSKADWTVDNIDAFAQRQIDVLTDSQDAADEA